MLLLCLCRFDAFADARDEVGARREGPFQFHQEDHVAGQLQVALRFAGELRNDLSRAVRNPSRLAEDRTHVVGIDLQEAVDTGLHGVGVGRAGAGDAHDTVDGLIDSGKGDEAVEIVVGHSAGDLLRGWQVI